MNIEILEENRDLIKDVRLGSYDKETLISFCYEIGELLDSETFIYLADILEKD